MTREDIMKQALEALECPPEGRDMNELALQVMRVTAALRERLAQPEEEPVAWVTGWHDGHCVIRAADPALMLPIGAALYTVPQRREWVGLTDKEIQALDPHENCWELFDVVRAAEAKLREKNT